MKALPKSVPRAQRPPPPVAMNSVFELDRTRIERALAARSRYKYVQPRVERHDGGWIIASPNCSRNVDAQGGEILIAWFEPDGSGRWRVHARNHAAGRWQRKAQGLTLPAALALVCADLQREYWV